MSDYTLATYVWSAVAAAGIAVPFVVAGLREVSQAFADFEFEPAPVSSMPASSIG